MNFHRSKRDKQTKACWDRVCLLFMVGACKVYSVIDGNDLSHRKPADNPSLCTEATSEAQMCTKKCSSVFEEQIVIPTPVWVIKKDLSVYLRELPNYGRRLTLEGYG